MIEPRQADVVPVEPRPEGVSLGDVTDFFRRRRLVILVCIALAVAAQLLALMVLPRTYEAEAILAVIPPQLKSGLVPAEFTVYGYQRLLQSDAVVAETQLRVQQWATGDEELVLEVGGNLRSRIHMARRLETASLAPMIEASVVDRDPARAAEIANTWAQVLLESNAALIESAMAPVVDAAEAEYPKTESSLAAVDESLATVRNEYQVRYDAALLRWNRRLADTDQEQQAAVAEFQAATRYGVDREVSSRMSTFQGQNAAATPQEWEEVEGLILQLAAVRISLAQVSPVVTVDRSISDDALWQRIRNRDGELVYSEAVTDLKLKSQESNPVYEALAEKVTSIEESIRGAALGRSAAVLDLVGWLEAEQQVRAGELVALEAGNEIRIAELQNLRNQELDGIRREESVRVDALERELELLTERQKTLAASFNEAVLARAQEGIETVFIAAPATVVTQPRSRDGALKLVFAVVLGTMLGVGVGLAQGRD